MSRVKKIEWFNGRDELDQELKKHGFFSLVNELSGSFWAVVAHHGPKGATVMAAVGGALGKASPYVALAEAVELAIARKGELK